MLWERARLGTAMLLIAESVFFFMLLLAFVYFREESLKAATATLNLRLTSFYTACLLISSLTLWRAQVSSPGRFWVGLTILFGGTFLLGQSNEYLRFMRNGVTMSQGLFGTTFFTLTGMHGFHVLIGLALLGVASVDRLSLQGVAMYWYFTGAVWLAIFAIVYVWSFI